MEAVRGTTPRLVAHTLHNIHIHRHTLHNTLHTTSSCGRARRTLWSGGEITVDFVDATDKISTLKYFRECPRAEKFLSDHWGRLVQGFRIREDMSRPPEIPELDPLDPPIMCAWDLEQNGKRPKTKPVLARPMVRPPFLSRSLVRGGTQRVLVAAPPVDRRLRRMRTME